MAIEIAKSANRETDYKKICFVRQKGFSLIELLVVLVIFGIIAAIGTPQFLGMRARSSVRADARDIHSAYRQAQTEAVKRSENACVVMDASSYQIQIADYFGTIEPGWSTYMVKKQLRPGTEITDLGQVPCFNYRGLPDGGVGTINISNPSLTMTVTLGYSGHVKSEVH